MHLSASAYGVISEIHGQNLFAYCTRN